MPIFQKVTARWSRLQEALAAPLLSLGLGGTAAERRSQPSHKGDPRQIDDSLALHLMWPHGIGRPQPNIPHSSQF